MSMFTIISGSLSIEPPLSHQELKKLDQNPFSEIAVKINVTETETVDGTLTKRQGVSVSARYDEERVSNYKVAVELQQLFDRFAFLNDDKKAPRVFNGYLICVYEDIEPEKTMKPKGGPGPIDGRYVPIIEGVWRYECVDGKLVTKLPVISAWLEKDPTS